MKKYLILCFLILNSCGPQSIGGFDPEDPKMTVALNYTFDQVKFIATDIENTQDPKSIQALNYTIDPNHRLLFRLKKMKKEATTILEEHPVLVRISINDGQINQARSQLLLCPMTTQWMMLATWKFAHPFHHGEWRKSGGDFDFYSCVNAIEEKSTTLKNDLEKKFCENQDTLCFDTRTIINKYAKSRGFDFGFILINEHDLAINIEGDASSRAPEIFWRKLR